MLSADDIIEKLNLKPLPLEGGYYRETYRSAEKLPGGAWPDRFKDDKSLGTAIYYFLTADTRSVLHRLPADEIYHFYLGDPVRMLLLYPDGKGETIILGPDIKSGQHLQFVVPRGVWQGSYLPEGSRSALMGTTISPGFDFSDYEPAKREILMESHPKFHNLIEKLV